MFILAEPDAGRLKDRVTSNEVWVKSLDKALTKRLQ